MAKEVYTAVTNMSALECNEGALAMISFFSSLVWYHTIKVYTTNVV